ncbi:MAG: pyridoxamine 5'-phosphate oxidase family protein [Lachnospiraceae bacterium]|nr:pyridoxamine 5'-phosphate oxidase family protein [Lachnospiraceae bacterium]
MTRREREVTDIHAIREILDKSMIVHIAMIDGDEPYLVPMNYGYTLEDGKLTLYVHGATEGRKLDVLRANPKVFVEMDCDIMPIEGKLACQYGTTYSSIMGTGTAVIVEDPEEKMKGLSILMKTQTGKDFEFNERLVSIVSVIRIDVAEYTAKARPLPPAMMK